MTLSTEPKFWVDYLVVAQACAALFTVLIALFVARTNKRQVDVADEKLKLDLHERRFLIYASAVELFLSFQEDRQAVGDKKEIYQKFRRSRLESTFLFPSTSSVRKILDEIDSKASIVSVFWQVNEELARVDPAHLIDRHREQLEAKEKIGDALRRLEVEMTDWMSFRDLRTKRNRKLNTR